jgi:hypothetical protein
MKARNLMMTRRLGHIDAAMMLVGALAAEPGGSLAQASTPARARLEAA